MRSNRLRGTARASASAKRGDASSVAKRTLSVLVSCDVANRAIEWCQQHGVDVSEAVDHALMLLIDGGLEARMAGEPD